MSPFEWPLAPLSLVTDTGHGGRWTSLRTPDREWLWSNPDAGVAAARAAARPGDAFVDAGGVEECVPTLRGTPDHGDAWSRPWIPSAGSRGEQARVALPSLGTLGRRTTVTGQGRVDVRYEFTGNPGTPFLHAVHALLELSERSYLEIPGATRALVVGDEAVPVEWPSGLDRLGPDDGSAVCAIVPHCGRAIVVDGDDALEFAWTAPAEAPSSLVLWRNLGGWPEASPYRSIGIEPLIGRAVDLRHAARADCARLGPEGRFSWQLTVSCRRRPVPHGQPRGQLSG